MIYILILTDTYLIFDEFIVDFSKDAGDNILISFENMTPELHVYNKVVG